MKLCSTEELRLKEIINLCDGGRLGYACDFEFDCDDGKILSLIVNSHNGFLGFGKSGKITVGWDKIQCIGEDTILVKVIASECRCCEKPKKKSWWFG